MAHSNSCHEIHSTIMAFVLFFLMLSPVFSSKTFTYFRKSNETLMQANELRKMKLINAHLRKINKPFIKSIKSPDNDIIDCVLMNLQPAFDLPELKGTTPLGPPELPTQDKNVELKSEIKQLWSSNGESCPNGTIPIRRTSASDILVSISNAKFGKKSSSKDIVFAEYAVGYAPEATVFGARARLNVWRPYVVGNDYRASKIWVVYDLPNHDFQSVEAGWHSNDYEGTGCFNLQCPGFVQTNSKIALGAAFEPVSTYNGKQYEVPFMVWKDPNVGNWWLWAGGELMGYWPYTLFTDLRYHATSIEFGGEVYSQRFHHNTSTWMGSGHFPIEGYRRAAYQSKLEYVDQFNHILPILNLTLSVSKPGCYDAKFQYSNTLGGYIFFGGPGNNPYCT